MFCFFVDQQDQWEFEEGTRMNLRTPLAIEDRDRKIDLSCQQQSLGVRSYCLVKLKPEGGKPAANPPQQLVRSPQHLAQLIGEISNHGTALVATSQGIETTSENSSAGPRFSDASLVTAAWLITARKPGTG
jgi:hypothetical protein